MNMSNKSILQLNKEAKLAEELAKKDLEKNGYVVTRTGKGSDFKAVNKKNASKVSLVEVKLRGGKLSKLQKATKRKCKKQGVSYFVYPVSDKNFDYYNTQKILAKIKNHPKFPKDFNIQNFAGKFEVRDPTTCPSCGDTAAGIINIIIKFGLRNMQDGTVREQSWCKECRGFFWGREN